jgi:adenylate cyclase class IV
MMIEYEIKYQANRSMLSQVIEDLSYVGQKQQNDTYYDTPKKRFFNLLI